ncbi:hypothetical protein RvY_18585 [Ramazzottius varieornatus]|uniref:RNA helicase n=1 Tax=Ramazzottius varieornatus TaxID=947166 RepID=A0A1D1W7T9_RAMVA|nr:hypothetical protein RvY_18585 [Ramazzottius varieornatus]
MPGLNVRLFIGRLSTYRDDVRGMLISKQHLHVVVATPGRLRKLVLDGSLHMTGVKHFLFDEADRILADERMREDTHEVFVKTDRRKQTLVFSSTYSGIFKDVCKRYLRRPFVWKETVARDSVSRRDTEVLHRYFYVHERDKMGYLGRFLRLTGDAEPERQILVFVDTRERCEPLLGYLVDQNFDAIQIQGGLMQACRFYCYALAKHSKKKVLVTTNLCARGLDIPEVSIIINFGCPKGRSDGGQLDAVAARDTYHHRGNRCGREMRRCLVLTFARDHTDVCFLRTEVARGLSVDILDLTD